MSEYEMVFMLSELVNRIWLILQVWMGLAIGYIALSHLYGAKLGLPRVVALTCLFMLATAMFFSTILVSFQGIEGYHAELLLLGKEQRLAAGTQAILESRTTNIGTTWLLPVSGIVTFFCALVYLTMYIHINNRRNKYFLMAVN